VRLRVGRRSKCFLTGTPHPLRGGFRNGISLDTDTNLRSYWSNQSTGLVDDIPGEIMLTPNLWGEVGNQ